MRAEVYDYFVVTNGEIEVYIDLHSEKSQYQTRSSIQTPKATQHSLKSHFFPYVLVVHLFMCLIHHKVDQVGNSFKIIRFRMQVIFAELYSRKKKWVNNSPVLLAYGEELISISLFIWQNLSCLLLMGGKKIIC